MVNLLIHLKGCFYSDVNIIFISNNNNQMIDNTAKHDKIFNESTG